MSFLRVLGLFDVLEFAKKFAVLHEELVEEGNSEKIYWFEDGYLLAQLDGRSFVVVRAIGPLKRTDRKHVGNLAEKGVGEDYAGGFDGMVQVVRFGDYVYAFFHLNCATAVYVKVAEIEL